MKRRDYVWRLSLCAMMIAVSAVLRAFSAQFYLGGVMFMRVNFDGAFLAFGAMIGGPVLGAASYAIADIIGYLIKPSGAFMPQFTLVAAAKGAGIGLFWLAARSSDIRRVSLGGALFFGGVTALGLANVLVSVYSPLSAYGIIARGSGNDAGALTIGLLAGGAAGLATCALFYVIRDRFGRVTEGYFRSLCAIALPSVLGTIINTVLIKMYFMPEGGGLWALMATRAGKEILLVALNAYLLTIIVGAYRKAFARRIV